MKIFSLSTWQKIENSRNSVWKFPSYTFSYYKIRFSVWLNEIIDSIVVHVSIFQFSFHFFPAKISS